MIQATNRRHGAANAMVDVGSTGGEIRSRLEQALSHQRAGRIDIAETIYAEVLAQQPDHPDALHFLGLLRFGQGRGDEAVELIERAVTVNPDFPGFRYNLGNILCDLGRLEEAVTHYRVAAELAPDNPAVQNNLGNALAEAGHYSEAVDVLRAVVRRHPDFADAVFNLGSALLESGDAQTALEACDSYERFGKPHCGIIACKGIALAELGRSGEAHDLHDYRRLVRPSGPTVPAMVNDLSAFNGRLRDHILGHPTLRADPFGHATRNGQHTGELFAEPWGPMREMQAQVSASVDAYLAGLPRDSAHPYLSYCPTEFRLTAWAVVMGNLGHQIAHNHPRAWVSGVYYVEVPDLVETTGDAHEGWLEFGRPAEKIPISYEPETTVVKPEEGLLVLFPGFMYHHTIPYHGNARRISLAFDAVPVEEADAA